MRWARRGERGRGRQDERETSRVGEGKSGLWGGGVGKERKGASVVAGNVSFRWRCLWCNCFCRVKMHVDDGTCILSRDLCVCACNSLSNLLCAFVFLSTSVVDLCMMHTQSSKSIGIRIPCMCHELISLRVKLEVDRYTDITWDVTFVIWAQDSVYYVPYDVSMIHIYIHTRVHITYMCIYTHMCT